LRPLSINNTKDKIVQAGVASLLEAIFKIKFLDSSDGFRPKRSTHTGLSTLGAIRSRYV
jgi:retron-type reverse transcriptase